MAETTATPAGGDDARARGTSTDDLTDLQRQLEESNRALKDKDKEISRLRSTSQATTTEAGRRIAQAEARAFTAEEQSIINGFNSAETEAAALEGEYAKAVEEGRSADMAKLLRKLTSAQNKLDWYTGQKDQIEARREAAKNAPLRPDTGSGDAVDTDPRTKNLSIPVKTWIRQHPDFLTDTAFYNDVMSAHYAAVKDGIKLDSDDYFDFIEERVGLKDAPGGEGEGEGGDPLSEAGDAEEHVERQRPQQARRTEAQRRQNTTGRALAPNRSTPGSQQQRQQRGQPGLTPEQMEVARISFPDEFAKNPADAYQAYKKYLDLTRTEGRLLSQQRA